LTPAEPRPAATVVLVRAGTAGLEVFLLRRHARSGFMANAYVFPGGRLDDADLDSRLLARLEGSSPDELAELMSGVASAERAAGHVVACIRETFEEAGVLLAHNVGPGAAHSQASLHPWRQRLNAGEISFVDLVETLDLVLCGGSVSYFDHWITPTAEPKRYDTRFFLAASPEGQAGAHDGHETTDSVWITPSEALSAHDAGEMWLAPPTWCILRELAALSDVDAAVSWASRGAVPTIQPTIGSMDGALVIALPGDPLHEGGGATDGGLHRVVLHNGRWTMPGNHEEGIGGQT
jgi:8-oxo-dGTP pyrophosphatase MutT (NUDIX family)